MNAGGLLRGVCVATLLSTIMVAGGVRAEDPVERAQRVYGLSDFSEIIDAPDVQKELKLKADQVKRIGQMPKFTGDPLKETDDEWALRRIVRFRQIAQILDPQQFDRFHQLLLQRQGTDVLLRREIADALKLTAKQSGAIQVILSEGARRLGSWGGLFVNATGEMRHALGNGFQQSRDQVNAEVLAVLTPVQKAKWDELNGAPVPFLSAQDLPRASPLPMFGERTLAMNLSSLLRFSEIQKELGLTADQEQQISEKTSGDQVTKTTPAALIGVLNAKQSARFHELRLQYEGGLALMRSEVAKSLQLTKEQQAKIESLRSTAIQGMRPAELDSSAARNAQAKTEAASIRLSNELLTVLTAEQKSRWKTMTGVAIRFTPGKKKSPPQRDDASPR